MSSKTLMSVAAMVLGLWFTPSRVVSQSAQWPCRARPIEPCSTHHGRLSSQNGIALKIWLIGTTRMVALENDGDDLPPLIRKYLDMTSPDHSYVYGDFNICPVEPDVAGHLRRVCVTGAEKLVVQRVDGSSPAFRLVSTWPADTGEPKAATEGNQAGLDPKIPAAIHSRYKDIRDAKDWRNPILIVSPNDVEVRSSALIGGKKIVRPPDLRSVLIGLPVSAWPYGRVILGEDNGLAGGPNDPAIKRNHDEAAEILKTLDIAVDWWPPA
jgi:hypothetical protein